MSTLMNAGKAEIAKLLNGTDTPTAFTYMAIGSGSTAEAATQTALVTEITTNGGARAAATCSYVANYTARWTHLFEFTGNVTLREVGIFNGSSSGDMLLRHVYPADKTYVNGESVEIIVDAVVA